MKRFPKAAQGKISMAMTGVATGTLALLMSATALGMELFPQTFAKAGLHEGSGTELAANLTNAPKRSNAVGAKFFEGRPNLIADVAEQVAESVVNIDISKTAGGAGGGDPEMELFRRFFGFEPGQGSPFFSPGGGGQQMVMGNGSGVVVDQAGHILTNNHVVEGANTITVTLNDGSKHKASVVGTDPYSDLAVLKISAPNLTPAVLGHSETLRPGEWVLAIGSPLGFDHTVTLGIISAISRRVPDLNANVDFIQTDAAINPGNSGGPLINLNGEVVGINTAISGQGQNIGFAIPVDAVREVVTELIDQGKIDRPWIGIAMAPTSADLNRSLGLPETTEGVIVAQVMPNSPALQAGFRQGDVIQRINGKTIKEGKDVQELVKQLKIGDTLSVQILRRGQMQALTVKATPMPAKAASR